MSLNCYAQIPGNPIAYWLSNNVISCFSKGRKLEEYATVRNGLKTGDNEIFVRYWYEVKDADSLYNATDFIQAMHSGKTWFPYNKGGEFRRWYGNDYYVLNWKNKGSRVIGRAKEEKRNVQDYPDSYKFIPIVTWSLITSSLPSFRFKVGCISDICGMSMYSFDADLKYLLAFSNTNISLYILDALNPTLNYQAGDIGRLPIVYEESLKEEIDNLSEQNIEIAKDDWDSFEVSWNFKKHPLV